MIHTFRTLILPISCLLFLMSCSTKQPRLPAAVTAKATPDARRNFFDDRHFYYIRFSDWDAQKSEPKQWNVDTSSFGSTFGLFYTDKNYPEGCPDGRLEGAKIWETQAFRVTKTGNTSFNFDKPSLKIQFTEEASRPLGIRAFALKSMFKDPSHMREAISWSLFGELGIPASRFTYAKFCTRSYEFSKYHGLYLVLERVDKTFLSDRWPENDKGNLYKGQWQGGDLKKADLRYMDPVPGRNLGAAYALAKAPSVRKEDGTWELDFGDRTFELTTNSDDPAHEADPKKAAKLATAQSYDDLALFIETLNGKRLKTPGAFNSLEYVQQMQAIFDVNSFLRWAVVNNLLGSWDNYWRTPSNYFLYNGGAPGFGKKFMEKPYFHWIPWDYDSNLGVALGNREWINADIVNWERDSQGSKLPLITNLLKNDQFLSDYLNLMDQALHTWFTPASIQARMDRFWNAVDDAAFAEALGPNSAPFTSRYWTNDEVWKHGRKGDSADGQNATRQFYGNTIRGIQSFVELRSASALRQLEQWRTSPRWLNQRSR